jgi:hypothetical protein
MTRQRARSAGEGRLGCILWLAVLAVGVMIAWEAIPVKIATAELHDFMVEQAKFGAGASQETIQTHIYNKARELDLPVDKREITVVKAGGRIRMRASFTVPLEYPGYTYYWDFDLEVDRPIFIF